jgi:beta-galactosidase
MTMPGLIGTAYYPDYYPEAEWAADLDRMLAAGVGSVRILEFAWSWYEPAPGAFAWDGLDRFLELCHARRLAVCLSTPTATPPAWFWERHPDARLIDADGRRCRAHRHMTCWNHPVARAEALRTIGELAARYGNHPAVWGWQIDNEPNYAEDYNGYYDFNPHALRDGQAWLLARYGSIAALNAAWFSAFWSQRLEAFDQAWRIFDPRTNPQAQLDFCRWREANYAAFVQEQAALLRRHTRCQRIGVNIPECGVQGSVRLGQDYWAQASGLDWVGVDIYAATADPAADRRAARYSTDLMRSVQQSAAPSGEFIVAETQGGPHRRTWPSAFAAQALQPRDLAGMNADLAARGAAQLWFFCWRATPAGAEMGMLGVQDIDGADTGRAAVLAGLAARREDLAAEARQHDAKPLALLHYARDAHRFLGNFPGALEVVERQMRGAHAALDAQGFRVRFITDAELAAGPPDAALLVLAESPLMDAAAQDAVIAWIGAAPGRELHLGPHTALLDGRGHLLPAAQRRLWLHLGITAGDWHDQGIALAHAGTAVDAYRRLTPNDLDCVEAWLADGLPARVRPRPNIVVHAWRWCMPLGEGHGSNPMPLAGTP